MKLLLCKKCSEIYSLSKETKTCTCGKTSGRYLDKGNIEYTGGDNVFVLGFSNSSLINALIEHKDSNVMGTEFTAFVIPKDNLK